jgi:hypothetical protein
LGQEYLERLVLFELKNKTQWEGAAGPFKKPPDLDLNNLPPDTIIFTDTNPKCAYYYFNGKWYYK